MALGTRGLAVRASRGRRAATRSAAHNHRECVERVRATMLDEDEVRRFSEVLRTLGEPTRLRILHALAASELCVFDLARGLGMSPSAISHQLRLLRALRMVRYRKQGREVYYALDDEHVLQLMSGVLSHLRHETRSS